MLTSAPRPAPPGKISAPRPASPSAPGLACLSPPPVDPLTYFAQGPGLTRGKGQHPQELRSGAEPRAAPACAARPPLAGKGNRSISCDHLSSPSRQTKARRNVLAAGHGTTADPVAPGSCVYSAAARGPRTGSDGSAARIAEATSACQCKSGATRERDHWPRGWKQEPRRTR